MNTEDAKKLSIQLMDTSKISYLTTIDKDRLPNTRAMFNLRYQEQFPGIHQMFKSHNNPYLTYFTTNTSSPKISQIRSNNKVSVYYCMPGEFLGLMLGGHIEITDDPDLLHTIWQNGWELYYPDGPDDQDYTLLRLIPKTAVYYHQLKNFKFDL